MHFYKIKETLEPNTEFLVKFINKEGNIFRIVSSSYYTVFENGKVIDFGPTRSADSFYRSREINISKDAEIVIKFIFYGIPTFEFADHLLEFGFELRNNDAEIKLFPLLSAITSNHHLTKSSKFSFQRAFIERYDLKNDYSKKLTLIETKGKEIKSNHKVINEFSTIKAKFINKRKFSRFDGFVNRNYLNFDVFKKINCFDVDSFLSNFENADYSKTTFDFKDEVTGLIKIEIDSKIDDTDFVVIFDENCSKKIIIGKDNNSDVICVHADKGCFELISNVPYSFKKIVIISKRNVKVTPSVVLIQNTIKNTLITNKKKIDCVIQAAINTFNQNSYDIFTDCPSRERAGWLCDSYFTGITENLLTGRNDIEGIFLENLIYSNSKELPEGVLPMCYPAEHPDKTFIPNWCLWFILEVERYCRETSNLSILEKAKSRIINIFNYFEKFEIKHHLLYNLESWVFVEWSKANDEDYIKGINFPTNMLYSRALMAGYNLFGITKYKDKANEIAEAINRFAYLDGYYVDNAELINNEIVPHTNHISETCQYYAAFCSINSSEDFLNRILNKKINSKLSPSTPFIGKILRLLLLHMNKRYMQVINEFVPYYYLMAKDTKTLWEKQSKNGSLNHGFASIVGPIIFDCYSKI